MRRQEQRQQRRRRMEAGLGLPAFLAVLALVAAALLVCVWMWARPGLQRAECCLHTRNYNSTIASFGYKREGQEAWKSPEATIAFAEQDMGHKLPVCPSGGVYSFVYGKQPSPGQPVLVCSLAGSQGHECYRSLVGEHYPSFLEFLLNRQPKPVYR